jgi:hypothetical protein
LFSKPYFCKMQAAKSLRRPTNWQDFETLCKKLWGEIWQCEEIKKNGRAGQAQHGVDVYGIPKGDQEYYGIQCKGKDEYTDKEFTEEEITKEISKAKNFKPQLKKLYFATTAVKDAKIEEFVREKNVENKQDNLFEVHLYSWEDIVELIDENKQTADWYIKSQNYKTNHHALLTFENGETELTVEPKFKQHTTVYRQEYPTPKLNLGLGTGFDQMLRMQSAMDRMIPKPFIASTRSSLNTIKTNLSMFAVDLRLHNTGTEPLKDYKANLSFEGDIKEIAKRNATQSFEALIGVSKYNPTTYVDNDEKTVTLIPRNATLVHDDNFYPETFYIKPSSDPQKIIIHYKLLSRNFKAEDSLTIHIRPDIEVSYTRNTVETKEEERTEPGEIEEVIRITD